LHRRQIGPPDILKREKPLKKLKLTDISKKENEPLSGVKLDELIPLPPPYDKNTGAPGLKHLTADQQLRFSSNLDGFVALNLPQPMNKEEEEKYTGLFVSGLKKLLTKEDNWAFLQPLLLSLDHCAQCQTCNDACPVYIASGRNDLYRPTYRSEIFRRLMAKYTRQGGKLLSRLNGTDIDLNWAVISRLYELSYRCTLCRRCAQACPIGVDNALLTRELRKLFSQELGWAPQELHEKGTVQQLKVGSPTGMRPDVAIDNVKFLDEDFSELLGTKIETRWDKEGADVLLLHSAGDILSFPESIAAFTILCNTAGISWTLSSDIAGYEGVNYGLFYDDVQLAKIAVRHAQVARKLKVKKIVLGECGHEQKALITVADRLLTGDLNIPRENAMTFLENIVFSGKIKFDPAKNDFPVTLHDPCNIVRSMGIVEPQRRIIRYLCPQFREMTPHGVDNYCCGGGGGLGLISGINFMDWRVNVAGRVKFKQVLDVFADKPGPEIKKYVCAPCLNCKMQFRDIFSYYKAKEKSGLYCGGLAELIVNAIVDIKKPFINWGEG
jgi:Fe-S oxidoreductase